MSEFTDSVFSDDITNKGYGGFSGFSQNRQSAVNVPDGIMWFVSLLPIFGLFLENYCINAYVGIILWSVIVVLVPFFCYIDCRKLQESGYDMSSAKKWFLVPPVYVYKRENIFHRSYINAVILGIGIFAALLGNGFTQSLMLNEEHVQAAVQNSAITNLDNFSGSSDSIIGEQLEKYFGKSIKWETKKVSDGYMVTCKGVHNNENMEVDIHVVHDGFSYQSVKVTDIKVKGVSTSKSTRKKLRGDIFIPENNKSEKTDNQKTTDA